MLNRLLADVIVLIHLGFVVFATSDEEEAGHEDSEDSELAGHKCLQVEWWMSVILDGKLAWVASQRPME